MLSSDIHAEFSGQLHTPPASSSALSRNARDSAADTGSPPVLFLYLQEARASGAILELHHVPGDEPLDLQWVGDGLVRSGSAEDAAFIMKNASSVAVVPGYGMAVAQAQQCAARDGR